jgi:TonB-dependent SusC/RagA subfamily outer membrane receptor
LIFVWGIYKRRKRTNNNYRWVCWRIRFVKSIETITVLKDAQAAIYGTIGANGVILITKQVKEFKAKNQFQFYRFSETTKSLGLRHSVLNESYANGGSVPFSNVSGLGKGTNWQKRF